MMATQQNPAVVDGDPAFYRVDTRRPAHDLPPGTVADAVNKRFEDGRAWPRLGVDRGPWGQPPGDENPCAFARFNDPSGFDAAVRVTDGVRPDGGRGRVWLIMSGNVPKSVPLNGHDVWGTARLIPCNNGLVLLRHGNERHYFAAAAAGGGIIQLNCAPDWDDGDQVLLGFDGVASLTGGNAPGANAIVYVKAAPGNQVQLFRDFALTQPYEWEAAAGRFYLERRATAPGFYGNGAPALLAQPDTLGRTLWDVGFKDVPVKLQVTSTVAATGVWTVPNHRLVPGDKVTLAAMPAGHTPANGDYYAYPLDANTLQLFDTQTDAMLAATGSVAGLEAVSDDGENLPTMVKGGASSLPMPPAREGFYTETNQLVLVFGANNVAISDPNDPLHYTPFQASLTANLGESDDVVAVSTFQAADCLVFLKQKSVLALYNFAEGPASWALRSVTREYGCVAALSARQWGSSLMFLSRRGLDRVTLSAFGVILPVEKPVSFDLKKYVDLIDWTAAAGAVVETWNNRLFLAAPGRGQQGAKKNGMVLVLNYLNSAAQKDEFGWEGLWQGDALQVYGWAIGDVAGEERLLFCDYAGQVNWLGDGWLDLGVTPVADGLLTRVYGGKDKQRKKWLKALLVWDTCGPKLSVTAVAPGHNELQPLLTNLVYDRTQYLDGSGRVYDAVTQQPPFNAPNRADYSLAEPGELIGGAPDTHQNVAETVRMRVDDWGLQLLITNTAGSCRLVSVEAEGVRGPKAGSRTV